MEWGKQGRLNQMKSIRRHLSQTKNSDCIVSPIYCIMKLDAEDDFK